MVDWDSVVTFSVGAAAVVGFLLLTYRLLLRRLVAEVHGFCVWMKKFQRDWDGEEAAAGRSRVPGVMERLNRIDGELTRNGGSSIKDQVIDTRRVLGKLSARVDFVEEQNVEMLRLINEQIDSGNDRTKEPQKGRPRTSRSTRPA